MKLKGRDWPVQGMYAGGTVDQIGYDVFTLSVSVVYDSRSTPIFKVCYFKVALQCGCSGSEL